MKTLKYETRDGKGNDIEKEIPVKDFKKSDCDCNCDICGAKITSGIKIKDAVSGHFTDWGFFPNGYICSKCSELFSVYPYSYIYTPSGIELMSVRQIRDRLLNLYGIQIPFMFCISTSQKKHLFYRAKLNNSAKYFAVNLETETILTSHERQKTLFDFVENLQTLDCTKDMLKAGKISPKIPIKHVPIILNFLWSELNTSREIQIPLFCGQKRDVSAEFVNRFCRIAKIGSIKPKYLKTEGNFVTLSGGSLIQSDDMYDYKSDVFADNSLLDIFRREGQYLTILVRERLQREKVEFSIEEENDDED